MSRPWPDSDRETAYTLLCQAVSDAGPAGETQFLARLALLLGEALGDLPAFRRALADAAGRPSPS